MKHKIYLLVQIIITILMTFTGLLGSITQYKNEEEINYAYFSSIGGYRFRQLFIISSILLLVLCLIFFTIETLKQKELKSLNFILLFGFITILLGYISNINTMTTYSVYQPICIMELILTLGLSLFYIYQIYILLKTFIHQKKIEKENIKTDSDDVIITYKEEE